MERGTTVRQKEIGQARRALSLFSGAGGFCEGMKLAGFDVRAAVEMDRFACETYRFNFPDVPLFEGDIADFNALPKAKLRSEYGVEDVDVVFGGPPCQGYSQIGPRDLNDPRNQLYREYIDTLHTVRPAIFVMENVPNMLLLRNGLFRDAALAEFARAGYPSVEVLLLDASEYGVPQQRRRVFYFGVRSDLCDRIVEMRGLLLAALEKQRVAKPATVWDAIGDLPSRVVASGDTTPYPPRAHLSEFAKEMRVDCEGRVYSKAAKRASGIRQLDASLLYNHHTKEIQARRLALIKLLKPGAKANSLPTEVWDGARPEKWRRLHPGEPAYTLLAQMHRDLSEFVHPKLHRWITVREALRLQSFHDGFVPVTSEWQQLKQIGNAVPPLLTRAVGMAAAELLAVARAEGGRVISLPRDHQLSLFARRAAARA